MKIKINSAKICLDESTYLKMILKPLGHTESSTYWPGLCTGRI